GAVTETGDGEYEAAFSLSMAGGWDMEIEAKKENARVAFFHLKLSPPLPGILDATDGDGGMEGAPAAGPVRQVPDPRRQTIGVTTGKVEKKNLSRTIRTVGRVEADERKLADVTLKYGGWIEKLFVNYTGAFVKKGEPLLTLYSQELFVSQQEFLNAIDAKSRGGSDDLVDAARSRLRLWDLSKEQIDEIARRGEPSKYLTISSPTTGYVTEKSAVEGMRVEPGMKLYRIADLSQIWVIAQVYEYEAPLIRVGQRAWVTSPYGTVGTREGRVDYLYPEIDPVSRTLPVRIVFDNTGLELRPGMFVDTSIEIPLGEQLAVPERAVLYSGEHRYVFVDLGGGRLEPREVLVGQRTDEGYAVLRGLSEGEIVVTSATFLISSEARLRNALPRWGTFGAPPKEGEMAPEREAAPPAHQHGGHGR
ncbi:MAG: efflux RND transporter periplasmic adaptor subunit, partial [Bdellovibrionota bacterium]